MPARKTKTSRSSSSDGSTATKRKTDRVKPKTNAQPAGREMPEPVLSAGETQWWFDARRAKTTNKQLLSAVSDSNCAAVLTEPGQSINVPQPQVAFVKSADQLAQLKSGVGVLTEDDEIAERARSEGRPTGVYIEVKDMEEEFTRCLELADRGYDHLVIDIFDATYIPYEQLLVRTRNTPTKILRSVPIKGLEGTVEHINQSLNAFATMEHGIGVLFRKEKAENVRQLSEQLAHRRPGTMPLVEAEVFDVVHCGIGHRACVDTTTLMSAEEGMIIGSTGWGGILVCSETHYLPHMNLREFRVNAGGVHSYVWGPGNRHLYLSEMHAGQEVLVVDIHGNTRVATVGRVKIERRPLLLIKARVDLDKVPDDIREAVLAKRRAAEAVTPEGEKVDREGKYVFLNTFLQNDWHVRVMGADGEIRHSTLVRPGEKLMAHVDKAGRHMGEAIEEDIVEK